MQVFASKNGIEYALCGPPLQYLKFIMNTECDNWTVDAKIRIQINRLERDASNGERRINEKICEIVRYRSPFSSLSPSHIPNLNYILVGATNILNPNWHPSLTSASKLAELSLLSTRKPLRRA